ncbi:MAG: MBOAT family protein [Gemmatimonadetes bacterium]|nr:MBOAT family protein [Gemmatimonadota bacterium]MBA4158343.1 MBOAT family protein [Gemmatimonadota bacterium]
MLFNSLEFLIFFPVVVALYFATPHRFRWVLLLAASYYFYASWKLEYLLLIIFSTLVDYGAALAMEGARKQAYRKALLALSLCANLGLLFAFKYFNFFNEATREVFDRFNVFYGVPAFDVLLPVGISFYTFQTLSYSIDVYRGRQVPERHLGIFALYVSFFPQLVAGPIERSTRLLPQFFERHGFDSASVTSGLRLMMWGFFKKVVIADRLAIYVNAVYGSPGEYGPGVLLLATYFFAFQIYCDFSGYSDIAIGTARVMGYDLMQNFRRPYFSRSIQEFWGRWHISLSTWFRDYLYIPLGGNRVALWRWYLNLMVVFVISGLWHGANWTFIVWGALHGFYLVFALASGRARDRLWGGAAEDLAISRPALARLREGIAVLTTFHLVLLAWIFFRANSLSDALLIIRNIGGWEGAGAVALGPMSAFHVAVASVSVLVLLGAQFLQSRVDVQELLGQMPVAVRWGAYYALIIAMLAFGQFDETEFIYFQF